MNLAREVEQLRKQAEEAARTNMRAEAQVERAEEDLVKAMRQLATEFGCTSVVEGQELLLSLEEQVKNEIARIKEALAQAN